jgi:UDP-glucose 4-epimerase
VIDQKFKFEIFNLGNGQGFSNQHVVDVARKLTGHEIPLQVEGKREGDAARLVASSEKARNLLGWSPKHPDLEAIIASAWDWHKIWRSSISNKD